MEVITNKFSPSSIPSLTTSWQVISWAVDENVENNVIRVDGVTASNINLPQGRYLIHSHMWANISGTNRCNLKIRITKNGVAVRGSYGSGYLRSSNNPDLSCDNYCIVESDGNDYIQMGFIRDADFEGVADATKTFLEVIKIDPEAPYAHYGDSTQTDSLGDAANGVYDVYWDTDIVTTGSITKGGTNDEEITLSANKKYLILCNVNYRNTGARTSRTIYPTIGGVKIPGVVGDEFGRNTANEFMSPNFLCIHETGNSSETLVIKSIGPYEFSSYIVSGGTTQRVINQCGLFILELHDNVKYYKGIANTDSFTQQNFYTNGIDMNIDEVISYRTGGSIYKHATKGLFTVEKRKYLIYSQIYCEYTTYNSSRFTRAISIDINSVRQTEYDGIVYVRGANSSQDVPQGTAQASGIFILDINDNINISINDDGYDDGSNSAKTVSKFPPCIFIIDIHSLQPNFTDNAMTELSYTSDLLRSEYGPVVTPANRGHGSWAGDMGMFKITGQSLRPFKNNQTDISLKDAQDFYARFGNNIKRRYQDANSIEYWFIPQELLSDWFVCTYDTVTDYYLYGATSNGWGSLGNNVTAGSVNTTNVTTGDIIESTAPISVYGNAEGYGHYSALCSKWAGYLFTQHVLLSSSEFVIFTMDENTDVILSITSSEGYSTDVLEFASASIPNPFSYHTFGELTTDKRYIISSNRPIVCGLYRDNDYGYQLYPMQANEKLYGFVEDEEAYLYTIPNGIDFIETNIRATATTIENAAYNFYTENIVGTDYFYGISDDAITDDKIYSSSFSNAAMLEANDSVLLSMFSRYAATNQYAFVSDAATSNIFIINDNIEKIGAISDSPVNIQVYSGSGLLAYTGSFTSGNGLYSISLGEPGQSFLTTGGRIETTDYCNIWAYNGAYGKYYYLHGTRDVGNFDLLGSDAVDPVTAYDGGSQVDACDRRTSLTIYVNNTTFAASNYFYANSIGTQPLPAAFYSDGTKWFEADGSSCYYVLQNC